MAVPRLSMDATGVIAHYVMDGNRPLTAESAGNTTFYLYGLGGIGEKTTEWNYSLPDGTNTPRQLTDVQGEITLSARYTPWGDSLELHGTGNFTFGYLGGVLDATTGLLYVGNGQYYDPSTGRFLTRDVYPNSPNPYVPWNPIGAIVGPLGLIALVFGRRKKGSKVGTFLVLLVVVGSVGMTLAGCGGGQPAPGPVSQQTADISAPAVPPGTPTPGGPGTDPGSTPGNAASPVETPIYTPTCTPTGIPTPTGTSIPSGSVVLDPIWGSNLKSLFDEYKKVNNAFTIIDFTILVLSGEFDPIVENSKYNDTGFRQDLAHAATHWLYINQKELSEIALLNWLGAMDSARSRYLGWKSSNVLGGPGRGEDLARYVVNLMLNPPAEWKRLDTGDFTQGNYWQGEWKPLNQEPYTWGNRSLYTVDPVVKLAELGYPPPLHTIPGGNPWYLLTLAQSNALSPYKR